MSDPRLVLTNANLVDGEHPAKPGTHVVVEGDRITTVGTGSVETRSGDRVVDLAGRSVMPGMVTCHFHSTYHELGATPSPYGLEAPPAYQALRAARNLELALQCGFTSAVSAGAPCDVDASMKRAINDGLIPGPRFVPGSRGAVHHRARQRHQPVVLGDGRLGCGALLRQPRGVPQGGP